jgi:hypothetical protein
MTEHVHGRPPKGAEHAKGVEGSSEAKQRLELILRTLSGDATITEVCAELNISEAHFHRLRERALQGAAQALETRAAGRPRAAPQPVAPERVAQLQQQVRDLELELMAAQVREEVALVMPQLLQPTPEQARKKKNQRKRERRARARAR